jgi:hypothetical protein
MPNWCHNRLLVEGASDQLDAFIADVRNDEQPLSFEQHIPTPAALTQRNEASFTQLCHSLGVPVEEDEDAAVATFRPGVRSGNEAWLVRVAPRVGDDWYRYRSRVHGTKWDANFDEPALALCMEESEQPAGGGVLRLEQSVLYSFTTAWAPPCGWLGLVAELYPALSFSLTYAECGNDIAGRVRYGGGALQEDVELRVDEVLAPADRWF